jgi:hypothetical protein
MRNQRKKKLFLNEFISDYNNPEQVELWNWQQEKKEWYEGLPDWDDEQIVSSKGLEDAIIEGTLQEPTSDEREFGEELDIDRPVSKEDILKKERCTFINKEKVFLWGYETIFNWLGNKYRTISYNISHNQGKLYEIH